MADDTTYSAGVTIAELLKQRASDCDESNPLTRDQLVEMHWQTVRMLTAINRAMGREVKVIVIR